MKEKEIMKSIYFSEQNILKSVANDLLECRSNGVHDNLLNIFDDIDELNRKIYKYLIMKKYIPQEKITKQRKKIVFEQLDELYLGINH